MDSSLVRSGSARRRMCGLLLVVSCGLTGCGADLYEQRLTESARYFAYLDNLNNNLGGQWQEQGIALRLPRQFTLIPPPAPKPKQPPQSAGQTSANGANSEQETVEAEAEPVDPRQPKYLQLELPGLMAAWTASMKTEVEGGFENHPAYLYLMSNLSLWAQGKGEEAMQFHKDAVQRLVEALGKPIQAKDWYEERVPSGAAYVEKKAFTATRIVPDEPIEGVPTEFTIYLYQKNDVQVVLLLVAPKNVDRQEQLSERVKLMLETMTVSGTKPQRGAGGQAGQPGGGQAPAPSGF